MLKMSAATRYGVIFLLLAVFFGVVGIGVQMLSERLILPQTQTAQAAAKVEDPEPEIVEEEPEPHYYIEIIRGCSPSLGADCVVARSGPGDDYRAVAQLRKGTVLKVTEMDYREDGVWFRVVFDEWLRYPSRVARTWYVSAEDVRLFKDDGLLELEEASGESTDKRIIVDRSEQTLYAYENDALFMQQSISTGLFGTPTPRGNFTIFKKTPTRYMQGPLPGISSKRFDLPGVPWNLYFTQQGAVIHGAYWHEQFGSPWSNGCVNVPTDKSEKLYKWADVGTPVVVQD